MEFKFYQIVEAESLGHERMVKFPRIVITTERYQDIICRQYVVQSMFNGSLEENVYPTEQEAMKAIEASIELD